MYGGLVSSGSKSRFSPQSLCFKSSSATPKSCYHTNRAAMWAESNGIFISLYKLWETGLFTAPSSQGNAHTLPSSPPCLFIQTFSIASFLICKLQEKMSWISQLKFFSMRQSIACTDGSCGTTPSPGNQGEIKPSAIWESQDHSWLFAVTWSVCVSPGCASDILKV